MGASKEINLWYIGPFVSDSNQEGEDEDGYHCLMVEATTWSFRS